MALTQYEISRRWRLGHPEQIRAKARRHYWRHREECVARSRAWRGANQVRVRQRSKAIWLKTTSDPVLFAVAHTKRRLYHERNREAVNARSKRWRENNPERVRALGRVKTARRKARKLAASGNFTKQQWLWRFQVYGERCAYCHCPLTIEQAQAEHRIPLNHGGTNWPANLVPACRKCNRAKSDKMPLGRFRARLLEVL